MAAPTQKDEKKPDPKPQTPEQQAQQLKDFLDKVKEDKIGRISIFRELGKDSWNVVVGSVMLGVIQPSMIDLYKKRKKDKNANKLTIEIVLEIAIKSIQKIRDGKINI